MRRRGFVLAVLFVVECLWGEYLEWLRLNDEIDGPKVLRLLIQVLLRLISWYVDSYQVFQCFVAG